MIKINTPKLLRGLIVAAVLLTGVFYFVSRAGYVQNQHATQVIGKNATTGIVAAQRIKVNLTVMHVAFAKQLVAPTENAELASEFSEARKQLSSSLVDGSQNVHFGPAETVPIRRLQYVLPLYQVKVNEALEAKAQGDQKAMSARALEAHGLMESQLLPAADQLDEANTTAMNNAYSDQLGADKSVGRQLLAIGLLLFAFLVGVQVYTWRKFRRIINPALAVASALVLGFTLYTHVQFTSVHNHLTQAKEQDFERLHIMWRAESKAAEARALMVLRQVPTGHDFDKQLASTQARVLNLPAGLSAQQFASQVENARPSEEATGYFAILARHSAADSERKALAGAISGFGEFAAVGQMSPRSSNQDEVFRAMLRDLGSAKGVSETSFREHVNGATSAVASMDIVCLVLALLVAVLAFFGMRARQNEYEV